MWPHKRKDKCKGPLPVRNLTAKWKLKSIWIRETLMEKNKSQQCLFKIVASGLFDCRFKIKV